MNEDSFLALPPLFAVADGMGGHGAGDLASRLAVDAMTDAARQGTLSPDGVLAALDSANTAIVTYEGANGMGTTITGLALLETTAGGDHLMVFNVGDSRVYRSSGGHLEQLTVDHSEVEELVQAGVITRDQARVHPRRNIVTRALGTLPPSRPDYWLLPATPGDRYLVCSDGLYTEVTDEDIAPLLTSGSPQAAADSLVAAAEAAGGHDNVTVIVIDVVGFGDIGGEDHEGRAAGPAPGAGGPALPPDQAPTRVEAPGRDDPDAWGQGHPAREDQGHPAREEPPAREPARPWNEPPRWEERPRREEHAPWEERPRREEHAPWEERPRWEERQPWDQPPPADGER